MATNTVTHTVAPDGVTHAAPDDIVTPIELAAFRTLPIVVTCGAVGGLAAAAVSRIFGVGLLLKWPLYKDLPIEIFMGAVAALFGCYLLTSTDFTEVKGFVFAVACGVFWGPVITGAQAYMNQYAGGQAVAQTDHARNTIRSGAAHENLSTATSSVIEALGKINDVSDPQDKQAITDNSKTFLSTMAANKNLAITAKVRAIQDVGIAAINNGSSDVAAQSYQGLTGLAAGSPSESDRSAIVDAIEVLNEAAKKKNKPTIVEYGARALENVRR
jgi:hypothetical protein